MEETSPKEIEYLTRFMDDQFEIAGFKFGLNAINLLLPEIADTVTTIIALYIFSMAVKYNIPPAVKRRMLLNIGIYFTVGLIPIFGDLFGVWWKPNRRNLRLLKANLSDN